MQNQYISQFPYVQHKVIQNIPDFDALHWFLVASLHIYLENSPYSQLFNNISKVNMPKWMDLFAYMN